MFSLAWKTPEPYRDGDTLHCRSTAQELSINISSLRRLIRGVIALPVLFCFCFCFCICTVIVVVLDILS